MIGSPRCLIWCAVSSRAQNEPDKISLPQQEADLRALAQQHNWQVVEVILVPGHSRRYIDFHELADDAAREGIDAFYGLKQHWEKRDFDVLIVRDGERFARTQALHAYIAERTIAIGARIYSLQDGWIDEQNYRMWIAMAGYKAAGDIDRMVRSTRQAMTARAERGLPTSSRIPLSHRLIRDPKTGKGLYLEVNEDKRRLWNDLAELILEGVAWEKIEIELYERFGHVNEDGEKYYANFMYRLVMKPVFWGHIARWHNNSQSKNGFKYGRWIYNDSEAVPDGTLIFRNTHPCVWNDELANRVRQELDRRSWYIRGKVVPAYTHGLSGLAVCGECGNFMSTFVSKGYRGLYCPATKGRTFYTPCNSRGLTNERQLIARMNEFLS